ncbi:acyltransferase family protein [Klebsiella aerogenes]|uniref:acyltransferase family protein n=1 Tax=Klebsiella aerogenes TaxID=548 RepID=UPI0021AB8FDB|nr:acyltransferase [Klebsiella aerogenes]
MIPSANGIRGLAVIIVLIAHALTMFIPGTRSYLAGTGKIGVWLFFVLSAFLLTNKFSNSGLNLSSLSNYLISRTFRIIPIFIIASTFYYFMGYYDVKTLYNIISMQSGYGHLWTIPVEFKFYFVLPFFFFAFHLIHSRYGTLPLTFSVATIIIAWQCILPYKLIPENSIETSWYIPCFLLGMYTSFLYQQRTQLPSLSKKRYGIAIASCLLGILFIIPSFSKIIFGFTLNNELPKSYLPLGIFWCGIIYFSCFDYGIFSKVLSGQFLTKIGNYSFSIYLFHWFVLIELSKHYPDSVFVMLIAIATSICCGWLVFKYVEKPIEVIRHAIQKKMVTPSLY